jgi:putative tricarboxylic transport membrane protein
MKNRSDILAGLLLIFIGSGAMIGAIDLKIGTPTEPQPGFFPFLSGTIILVFSLVILLQGCFGRSKNKESFGEVRRPAMLVGILILFVAILEPVGFIITSLIAIALVLLVMGVRSWQALLVSSFAFSIGTFVLFDRLLGIALPAGILARIGL